MEEINWHSFVDNKDAIIALQGSLITELQEQLVMLKKIIDIHNIFEDEK